MAEQQIGKLRFILSGEANPKIEAFLHQQIKEFNNQNSAHHLGVRTAGVDPLIVLVRDADGEIMGGLAGSTYWESKYAKPFCISCVLVTVGRCRWF